MKVLIVTHGSLEIGGGEELNLLALATSLHERGHEVKFANFAAVGREERRISLAKLRTSLGSIDIVEIKGLRLAGQVLPLPTIQGARALSYLFQWADVVVFGQYYGFDIVVSLLARLTRKPTMCSQANTLFRSRRDALRDAVQEAYARLLGYPLLMHCDAVRVLNSEDWRFLLDRGHHCAILLYPLRGEFSAISDKKTLPPAYRAAALRISSDERFKIIIAGRMTHQKGIDIVAEAISRMTRQNPSLQTDMAFYLAGTSEMPKALQELHSHYPSLITNMGVIPREFFGAILEGADIALVPSRYESFGMIAAEAQSMGKPVVATNITGLREVVSDGTSGILLDDWSPQAFASAILCLKVLHASDPERWRTMQDRAKSNYERVLGSPIRTAQFNAFEEALISISRKSVS
jgi:glycosyltransferase involved in cell wall biosynthesis